MCTEKDKLAMCAKVCQTVLECQINVTDLLEIMSVTDGFVFAKSHTHTGTAGNCVFNNIKEAAIAQAIVI